MSMSSEDLFVKDCLTSMLSQLICAICLDVLNDPVSTRCGHHFCQQCISKSLSTCRSVSCPLCKANVTRRSINSNTKVQSFVKGIQEVILSVSKDVSYDIMQLSAGCKESTNEAFSPTERKSISKTTVPFSPAPLPKSSEKVETWLKEFTTPNVSQISEAPNPVDNPGTQESESDFDSVSQVKPDSVSNATGAFDGSGLAAQGKSISKRMYASCTIEDDEEQIVNTEDCDVPHVKPAVQRLSRKTKASALKETLDTAKISFLKTIQPLRKDSHINSINLESSQEISQNSIDSIKEDGEKENSANNAATRSPGWTRIKKMKMEFHESPKSVLRAKNAPGLKSPAPTIEEPVSEEGEPCISLTLSSPSIRTKEKINMIVNDLEAEIELYEKESSFETKRANMPCKAISSVCVGSSVKGISKLPDSPSKPEKVKDDTTTPLVKFLKLGSFTPNRSHKIPFILKGPLMHLLSKDPPDQGTSCVTERRNVHTQWSPPIHQDFNASSYEFARPEISLSDKPSSESKRQTSDGLQKSNGAPSQINTDIMDAETVFISQQVQQEPYSPKAQRRSDGAPSEGNTEFMDAETIVAGQPNQRKRKSLTLQRKSCGEIDPDFMDAETVIVSQKAQQKCINEGVDTATLGANNDVLDGDNAFNHQQTQKNSNSVNETKPSSPLSKSFSDSDIEMLDDPADLADKAQSQPLKIQSQTDIFSADEEPACKEVPDLNDSSNSSSDFNGEKIPKRIRALSCSSDSSDSDIRDQASFLNVKKKRKNLDLSKTKDIYEEDSPCLDVSILGGSMFTPDIEADIKAKIEAGLKETEKTHTSDRYNLVNSENRTPPPALSKSHKDTFERVTYSDQQVSNVQIDSDGDSDIIRGTPATGLYSRDTSQSDDIVPDSQPFVTSNVNIMSCSSSCYAVREGNASHSMQAQPEPSKTVDSKILTKSNPDTSNAKFQTTLESSTLSTNVTTSNKETATKIQAPSNQSIPAVICDPEPKKYSFICSNLPSTSVAEVQTLAQLVGAEFSSRYCPDTTTHLVVKVNAENAADKTYKYLCAVAAGKWVVSIQWVVDSLKAGKLLPEEPYEALDSSGERGPTRSRLAHKDGTLLFHSFEFYCLGDFPDLSKPQMEYLLTKCGAVMVEDPGKFSFSDGVIPISLAVYDEEKDEEFLPWWNKHGSLLVQHDWVLDCIGKFNLTSMYSSILCDTPDDLISIGIPSYLVEPSDSDQTEQ